MAALIGCQQPSQAPASPPSEALRVETLALPSASSPAWTSFATPAREQYAGVELGDGSVLVCGGLNTRPAGYVSTCDRLSFDTTLHALSFPLPEARVSGTLTLLPPDRVLLAGGIDSVNHALTARSSSSFGTWSANSDVWGMPEGTVASPSARVGHTASLLDGSVVLVGGEAGVHAVAAIDVRSDQGNWVEADLTTAVPTTRTDHSATVLKSQSGSPTRVLILGGYDSLQGGYLSSGFIFSAPDKLTPIKDMPEPRKSHTATLLDDGSVLVVGGEGPTEAYLATAFRYYPEQDSWVSVGSTVARKFHAAARLGGDVIVAGGVSTGGPTGGASTLGGSQDVSPNPNTVQRYHPLTNIWSAAPNLLQGRRDFQLLVLDQTHLLAVGGANDTGTLASSELFSASALGQPSTDPNSCVSGHIADGVCCDEECSDPCHWCKDPTAPGTCQLVTGATQNQNGCANHLQCSAGACPEQCDASSLCQAGFFCASGLCQATKELGVKCSADAECAAGAPCVDGVCCESRCSGSCEACDQQDRLGLCRALPAGDAPRENPSHPPCPAAGDSACAASCDGNTTDRCVFAARGSSCGDALCTDTRFQPARSCDGKGTCTPALVKNCAPYTCDSGGCRNRCGADAPCSGGAHCSNGTCAYCDDTACNGYRCDSQTDECRSTCDKSETDCTGGYYCHPLQHRCVLAVAFPAGELPSCGIGREPPRSRHSLNALALLVWALAIRRQRSASRRLSKR